MFYWNHRGTFVILTDAEELALVRNFARDAEAVLDYHTSLAGRRRIERKIFAYLQNYLENKPEEFRRKYVFRSWYGNDAQQIFPAFLSAYGRATRLAIFDIWGGDPFVDDSVENIIHAGAGEIYNVTLLTRSWWPPRVKAIGRISFRAESIEKLTGEVCSFVLLTETFNVRFGRDFIRITVR